jgi:hypothetical protein
LLLFLEKEEYHENNGFLGGQPPNPLGRLRRVSGIERSFCEAEQTLFASFSGKRRIPRERFVLKNIVHAWCGVDIVALCGEPEKVNGGRGPTVVYVRAVYNIAREMGVAAHTTC